MKEKKIYSFNFLKFIAIMLIFNTFNCSWNNPFLPTSLINNDKKTESVNSSNANLNNLLLSSGTLSPVFAVGTTSYTASVSNATASITVTPTAQDITATIQVHVNSGTWTNVTSGTASGSLSLPNIGATTNSVEVKINAQDGSTKIYTITVTRLSNNANLSNLTLSTTSLSPSFASGTTSYTNTPAVVYTTTTITVTPTKQDSTASIQVRVNGGGWSPVTSGSPSGALSLNTYDNSIEVRVTAQDGTTKTYTVTARRGIMETVTFPGASNVSIGFGGGIAAPVHTVSSISSFKLGKYEVTYTQWNNIKTWAASHGYTFANAGSGSGQYPVLAVNWRDSVVWCNALSEYEGLTPVYCTNAGYTTYLKAVDNTAVNATTLTLGNEDNPYVNWSAAGYRLPTEAEWESCARYINGSSWTSGDCCSGGSTAGVVDSFAWYSGNSGGASQIIGTKTVNQLGIYDMSGNAPEWCWDWYGSYTTSSPYTDSNTRGPSSSISNCRVVRITEYGTSAANCTVTNRGDFPPSSPYHIGFRVAKQ